MGTKHFMRTKQLSCSFNYLGLSLEITTAAFKLWQRRFKKTRQEGVSNFKVHSSRRFNVYWTNLPQDRCSKIEIVSLQ